MILAMPWVYSPRAKSIVKQLGFATTSLDVIVSMDRQDRAPLPELALPLQFKVHHYRPAAHGHWEPVTTPLIRLSP